MDMDTYQAQRRRTAGSRRKFELDIATAGLGLTGEAGEVMDAVIAAAGINKPHCNIICNKPNVFKVIDFPPALGPLITMMRSLACKLHCIGTVGKWRSVFCNNKTG